MDSANTYIAVTPVSTSLAQFFFAEVYLQQHSPTDSSRWSAKSLTQCGTDLGLNLIIVPNSITTLRKPFNVSKLQFPYCKMRVLILSHRVIVRF